MSPPWMPLYIADYIADTGHLGALESGGYLHLIMHYWRHGGIPSDDASLARIARMTAREWAKSRALILAFFDEDLRHKRIDSELEKAQEKSDRRADAGARGGKAKALKIKERDVANATNLPEQKPTDALASSSQPQSQKKERAIALSRERDAEFAELRSEYPKRPGDHPAPARKAFDKVRAAGVPMSALLAGARAYRLSRDGEDPQFTKTLGPWLNAEGWKTDYSGPKFQARAGPQRKRLHPTERMALGITNDAEEDAYFRSFETPEPQHERSDPPAYDGPTIDLDAADFGEPGAFDQDFGDEKPHRGNQPHETADLWGPRADRGGSR